MHILVINSGSSSVKYQLFDMAKTLVLTHGQVERIGESVSHLTHNWCDTTGKPQQLVCNETIVNHSAAFEMIKQAMHKSGTMELLADLAGIGHRVVHGGEQFSAPIRIDQSVMDAIRQMIPLAPLHNPANLIGIEASLDLFPDTAQVAVFDTAFHQTMPSYAYRYPLPEQWYTDNDVRRYGFHGTSHQYVAQQAAQYLQQPLDSLNLITLHLGNGASAAALRHGYCVDTSMGMTPLEGLMMGTRCGDIDPAILFYMNRQTGIALDTLEAMLNTQSGLKGICDVNDMREVQAQADTGNVQVQLALDMYCYRIKKYIGAYYAVLGGADALVFTAGIGEHSARVRKQVCAGLDKLGIVIDDTKNNQQSDFSFEIHTDSAEVKLLVVPTNEELAIAHQTVECISAGT